MAVLRIYMYSIICLIFYIAKPGSTLFSWHPTLMTFTSMFLLYEAIILFDPKKGLLKGTSRANKINIHGMMQLLAVFIMSMGFTVVAMNKFHLNKPHFSTLHAVFGCIAGVLIGWQAFLGFVLRFPILSPVSPYYMKLGHTILGTVSYLFVCLAIIIAIFSDYMTERTTPFIQILLITLPMIAFSTSFTRFINKVLQKFLKPK